ncbi:MAG: hypothetical protein JSW65_03810 [Candidatus Bipolaricaulota bacterium]|nr:MAG: hypothetical protein JSW65_03810 [Candidatus Bipolaricaulota bacterium]
MEWRSVWLIAAAVVLGAAAVLLLLPRADQWTAVGDRPLVVGSATDPFSYDGTHVVFGEGRLALRADSRSMTGELDAEVRTDDPAGIVPLSGVQSGSSVGIRSVELVLESVDAPVHGDTGLGGAELPETRAWLAGSGSFDLVLDGERVREEIPGRWLVADAVRRDDGAVRRGGLVYSPLLRDKTGFSVEDRLEATIFLTLPDDATQGSVELHVVFAEVTLTSGRRSER